MPSIKYSEARKRRSLTDRVAAEEKNCRDRILNAFQYRSECRLGDLMTAYPHRLVLDSVLEDMVRSGEIVIVSKFPCI